MKLFGLIFVIIIVAWASIWGPGLPFGKSGEYNSADTKEEANIPRERIEVYKGITAPTTATKLDLSARELEGSLKAEVNKLTMLTELNLSNNKFTGVPAEIGQLKELSILNLSGNPITGLPQELGNLQKLTILDLRSTSYSKMDLEIIKTKLPNTTQILVD